MTEHKEIIVKWDNVITEQPFVGDINLGNGTMFRIFSFRTNHVSQKKTGVFLCIERASSGWIFQANTGRPLHPSYVAEKLLVKESADINIMTDWLNAQLDNEAVEQFGEYDEKYILDNPSHGLIGEYHDVPLCPEIIGELA